MDLARARHGGPRQYTPRMGDPRECYGRSNAVRTRGVLIQKFRILQVFLVFSLMKKLYIDIKQNRL